MVDIDPIQAEVECLGECKVGSPLPFMYFVPYERKVTMEIPQDLHQMGEEESKFYSFEESGPKERIYFDPSKTKCAIVTCGGLCPGINDVIRAIVMEAYYQYGISSILGIRFGLQGFIPKYKHEVWELTPSDVSDVHEFGGTILGSSRGHQSSQEIVEALERLNVNVLFMVGGDGAMKAAGVVAEEVRQRNMKLSVIGIPKTIDNDIPFISRSFGFDTAVSKAIEAIRCAHTEATGAYNGIGMVELMGRESGFIAAEASLSLKEVNFVLIPEDPFELEGDSGLLNNLRRRLRERGHAVIVVAEGAGQDLCCQEFGMEGHQLTDASGNPVLGDICALLQDRIKDYFKQRDMDLTLKFIDPSYIIRSVPANSGDRVYCGFLGQNAVHAAMAGKTNMVVSKLHDRYVDLPLDLVTQRKRRKLDTMSNYWRAVLESTGQPLTLRNS
ncbi:MAG: ATP-dependent 6-phosphofructokinase [Desulfohalobiaceae bacterium]